MKIQWQVWDVCYASKGIIRCKHLPRVPIMWLACDQFSSCMLYDCSWRCRPVTLSPGLLLFCLTPSYLSASFRRASLTPIVSPFFSSFKVVMAWQLPGERELEEQMGCSSCWPSSPQCEELLPTVGPRCRDAPLQYSQPSTWGLSPLTF